MYIYLTKEKEKDTRWKPYVCQL